MVSLKVNLREGLLSASPSSHATKPDVSRFDPQSNHTIFLGLNSNNSEIYIA